MKLHMDVIVMCEKIFPIIDLIIKPNIPWKYVLRRFKFYNLFSETFYEKMENSQKWGNYDYLNYVTEVILGSFNRDKSNAIDMIKFILCNYSYLEEDEINEILILDDTVDILIKKQYNDLDDLDDLIFDINKSISNEKHVLTLDRLHTLMLKWVKKLCSNHCIEFDDDKERLDELFKKYVKYMDKFIDTDMTKSILKSNISLFAEFNNIRNNHTYAHDNNPLNNIESKLIYRNIVNVIYFVRDLEKSCLN